MKILMSFNWTILDSAIFKQFDLKRWICKINFKEDRYFTS